MQLIQVPLTFAVPSGQRAIRASTTAFLARCLPEPLGAELWRPHQCLDVDVDDAEAVAEPGVPLEVVREFQRGAQYMTSGSRTCHPRATSGGPMGRMKPPIMFLLDIGARRGEQVGLPGLQPHQLPTPSRTPG